LNTNILKEHGENISFLAKEVISDIHNIKLFLSCLRESRIYFEKIHDDKISRRSKYSNSTTNNDFRKDISFEELFGR